MHYGPNNGLLDNAKSVGELNSSSINFMKMEREQVLQYEIFYVGIRRKYGSLSMDKCKCCFDKSFLMLQITKQCG